MNKFQKVIKVFAICLAVFIIGNICMLIFSGIALITGFDASSNSEKLKEFNKTYQNIEIIDIDIASSNIEIKSGNEFKIEADTKNELTCKEVNGKLKVEEDNNWFINSNLSGNIVIYIPEGIILRELDLDTGAGEIKVENIKAEKFDLDQGAGLLKIINSKFDKIDIDGGAGKIEVDSSELNNLDLDCGAGKVEIESKITGNSKISAGVGEINLSLIGNKEDYQITAEKGIGSIRIENQECSSNTVYGTGDNKIKIEGGIGSIIIEYKNQSI